MRKLRWFPALTSCAALFFLLIAFVRLASILTIPPMLAAPAISISLAASLVLFFGVSPTPFPEFKIRLIPFRWGRGRLLNELLGFLDPDLLPCIAGVFLAGAVALGTEPIGWVAGGVTLVFVFSVGVSASRLLLKSRVAFLLLLGGTLALLKPATVGLLTPAGTKTILAYASGVPWLAVLAASSFLMEVALLLASSWRTPDMSTNTKTLAFYRPLLSRFNGSLAKLVAKEVSCLTVRPEFFLYFSAALLLPVVFVIGASTTQHLSVASAVVIGSFVGDATLGRYFKNLFGLEARSWRLYALMPVRPSFLLGHKVLAFLLVIALPQLLLVMSVIILGRLPCSFAEATIAVALSLATVAAQFLVGLWLSLREVDSETPFAFIPSARSYGRAVLLLACTFPLFLPAFWIAAAPIEAQSARIVASITLAVVYAILLIRFLRPRGPLGAFALERWRLAV